MYCVGGGVSCLHSGPLLYALLSGIAVNSMSTAFISALFASNSSNSTNTVDSILSNFALVFFIFIPCLLRFAFKPSNNCKRTLDAASFLHVNY